jgi:molybdenum cofactor synthesis domain-containing protein
MNGTIISVNTSRHKGKKSPVGREVRLIQDSGIEGDFHAGRGHRQISLLDQKHIRAFENGGRKIGPGDFGENIVCAGLNLDAAGLGSEFSIGPEAKLAVTQIGKDCLSPCEIYRNLGDCIMPRTGLFCRVLKGGGLSAGSEIREVKHIERSCIQAAVLVMSDSCSAGTRTDTAGRAVSEIITKNLRGHLFALEILPDQKHRIVESLRKYVSMKGLDLILCVGGTGFSPSDCTPEATLEVIDRLAPGLDEMMRAASMRSNPHGCLSRGVSGIKNRTLIVNLPGSERAACENLKAILPALPHGLLKLRGDKTPCGG